MYTIPLSIRYVLGIWLLTNSCIWAQNNEIEVHTLQNDSAVVFTAQNHSNLRQELTLTLTVKNLTGYQGPITRLIEAGDSVQVAALEIRPREPWSLNTSYSYIAKPTEEEAKELQEQLRQELFESLDTRNNPIIIFYGEGCTRSEYAREYLEKKKVPFKYLESRDNEAYAKIMFQLIGMQDPETQRIEYPVFLVNGRLDYDIENLRWYLKELTAGSD